MIICNTYFYFCRTAPINSLVISELNVTEPSGNTLTTLHLVENRPSTLRCTSFGGYPPPNLEIYVGRRDVTAEFLFSNSASLHGSRGLRHITMRTDRVTHSYVARYTDDNEKLKCIAIVSGLKTYTQFIHITVDCK